METAPFPPELIWAIAAILSFWLGLFVHARRSRRRRAAKRAQAALILGWTADQVQERLFGGGHLFRFRGQTPKGVPWVLEAKTRIEGGTGKKKRVRGVTAWRIGEPASGDPALLLMAREPYETLQSLQGHLGGAVSTRLLDQVLKHLGHHDSTLAAMLSRRQAVLQTPELQEWYVALVADQDAERLVSLDTERALHRLLTSSGTPASPEAFLCVYVGQGTLRVAVPRPIDTDDIATLEALVDLGRVLAKTATHQ